MTREDVWEAINAEPLASRYTLKMPTTTTALVAVAFELREIAEQLKRFNDNCVTGTVAVETTVGPNIHIPGALRTCQVPD